MAEELPPFDWDYVWLECCRCPETCGTSLLFRFMYGCYPYTDAERHGYRAAIEKALAGQESDERTG